jgi:hypothetical protein
MIIRKSDRVRGRDRKGIRHKAAVVMARPETKDIREYDKPCTMIETMRIEGSDTLTAQDNAICELLFAHARHVGIDVEWHVLPVDEVSRFLDVGDRSVRVSRIRDSIRRLGRTQVTYDFRSETTRIDGAMPLVLAQIEQDLLSGTSQVRYSIPAPVRAAILEATAYAMLELDAFPKFGCRYTARLYPRLAWRSAIPGQSKKRWEVEPVALAEALSYPVDGDLHVGSFMRRCVEPALADIKAHVSAFTVKLGEPIRGEGRGRPVERLVYEISSRAPRFATAQAVHLTQRELDVISRPDDTLATHELPSTLLVGKAVRLTGLPATEISEGWRKVYAHAKTDPGECMPGVEGNFLAYAARRGGVGAAFEIFAEAVARTGRIPEMSVKKPEPARAAPQPEPQPRSQRARQKTPEEVLARRKELAALYADHVLDALAGYYPGIGRQFKSSFGDEHFTSYCDPETPPWSCIEEYMQGFDVLVRALAVLANSGGERRRKSLSNLAYAAKAWDLKKMREIAGAILAAAHAGEYPPPPKAPRVRKFGMSFPEVTEADAERDYADPAYATTGVAWDDRAEADMEPAD